MAKFALLFFAVPAAIVGFTFGNRITYSPSAFNSFFWGVLVVIFTNVTTALFLAVVSLQFEAMHNFGKNFVGAAGMLLSLDVIAFYGVPFIIGGVAAFTFREVIHRTRWMR